MAGKEAPKGGIDYPRTGPEFDAWFGDEASCVAYLVKLRWPDGFVCPHCGRDRAWLTGRGLYRCASCQRQTSPTAGTIFEGTRKPLRVWFQVMWQLTSHKNGVSAKSIETAMGFGSYQTAWAWLHKLRRATVRPERERLSGTVEIDETFLGGVEPGVKGRQTYTKSIVVIAVELNGDAIARIRLTRVPDASARSLHPFILANVEAGSTLRTDAWKGYNGIERRGYLRDVINLSASPEPAHVSMPYVHRIAALLKRWWLSTHQGAIRRRHLDSYLDEFAFRFNRRSATARGLLFYRLMQQAITTDHPTYKAILGGKETKPRRPKRTNPVANRRPARRVSVSLPLGHRSPATGRWSVHRRDLTSSDTTEPSVS